MFDQIRKNKKKTFFIAGLVFAFVALVLYALAYMFTEGDATFALAIALIFSGVSSFYSYYFSDKIILKITKAYPADEKTKTKIENIMSGLCISSGLPMPNVFVIDDDSMNAFATGRNPKHAVVCVTKGLVEKLDYYQLEAVLAHELSHIKNYDILLSTVVTVMVGAVIMLSHLFQRAAFRGSRGSKDSGNGIIFIIGLILLILAPIVGQLLKMALSRSREYLADATAVEFTRNPEGLASALELIGSDSAVECADPATSSMFIASPDPKFSPAVMGAKAKKSTKGSWFATHPPIEERVNAIRNISA